MSGRIEIFNNKNDIYGTNSDLNNAVRTIFSIVIRASDTAYNKSVLQTSNPKQNNWLTAIEAYFSGQTVLFMNAIYGYAVEELVNIQLSSAAYIRLNNFRVLLQVTHGSTRPDIVLKDRFDKEVAWLDITSENSAGHISGKVGSGWKTTPFVAELLYPVLDLTRLRTSDDETIGARAHALSTFRQRSVFRNNVESFFYLNFINAMDLLRSVSEVSQPLTALAIENKFNLAFQVNDKHAAIKSMLKRFIADHPYSNTALICRELLAAVYSQTKQNKPAAEEYILKSYYKNSGGRNILF